MGQPDDAGGDVLVRHARLRRRRRHHQHELPAQRDDPQHAVGDGPLPPDLRRRHRHHVLHGRLRAVAAAHGLRAAARGARSRRSSGCGSSACWCCRMPWHLVGLLGMPRRMAYFDYTHPGAAAAGVDGDGVDASAGCMLVVSALLLRRTSSRARGAGRGDAVRRSPSAARRIAGDRTPVALNGFGALGRDDDRPDGRQLRLSRSRSWRSLKETSVPVDSDRGPVMAEPRAMYAWRNPWFRWSVVVAGRADACVALLVGFVWLPSVHGDFTRARALGEHLPRGRRAGDWARRRRSRRRRAPASTDVVLDARDGARGRRRRGRPRRDARAATARCATARRA